MWKTPEGDSSESEFPAAPITREKEKGKAIIGPTISIKGEIAGEEDLIIQGQVEGKIDLQKNDVTVAGNGCVIADVYAKVIHIEGEAQGNLYGKERIVLSRSGVVCGDMTAPLINLQEGSEFRGTIDMDTESGEKETLQEVLWQRRLYPRKV